MKNDLGRLSSILALSFVCSSCTTQFLTEALEPTKGCTDFEGDSLVFSSYRPLSNDNDDSPSLSGNIWRHFFETGVSVPLTSFSSPGLEIGYPTYGANGTKIYFQHDVSLDGSGIQTASTNLWEMNSDGSGLRAITRNTAEEAGSYSPSADGDFVAFVSRQALSGQPSDPPSPSLNLWVYQISTDTQTALTNFMTEGVDVRAPHLVGDRIVYQSTRNVGAGAIEENIWATGLDGSSHVRLTPRDDVISHEATMHSNGKVAFLSKLNLEDPEDGEPTSSFNLWIMDFDGGNMIPLTRNTEPTLDSYQATFSRDGTYVSFSSYQDISGVANGVNTGSRNTWIARVDGGGSYPLTRNLQPSLGSYGSGFGPNDDYVIVTSTTSLDGLDNGAPAESRNLWKINLSTGEREKFVYYDGMDANSLLSGKWTNNMFGHSEGCY